MIFNQWYAVLDSREVPKSGLIGVTRLGEKLCFFRDRVGNVRCIVDKCAHRGAALSVGKICGDGGERVQCPFHGLEYDGNGRVTVIPANGRTTPVPENFFVHAYPARDAHGWIWVWWGDAREDLPPVPWFEDIDNKFSSTLFIDPWPVHYSRAVENQLDVVHVPFVHYNTIGKGGRTVVDGPVVIPRKDGRGFRIYVFNRVEDGTPARKPEEIPDAESQKFFLEFRWPNVWENHIIDPLRIGVAFVPVDENNTLVYMRVYQKFLRIPGLRGLINWIGMRQSKKVLGQDTRVVITQVPKKTTLKMGENLFQGDSPIVYYRRERDRMQREFPTPQKQN
jgi:phenylpropionate dioxygenase-like ring-hydroxylating dioxygenase large terminal subunit